MKLACVAGLTLAAGMTLPRPCRAQAPPNPQDAGKGGIADRRVSVIVEDATLASVLKTLMQSVDADYTLAPELRRITVTAHLTNLPLRIALDTLLRSGSAPATYHVENGVYFFTLRTETSAQIESEPSETPLPNPAGVGQIHTVRVNFIDAGEAARLFGGMAFMVEGQSYGVVNPSLPGGIFGPRGGAGAAAGQNAASLQGSLFDGSLVLIGNAGAGFR
jgi:hypothetical protein